MLLVLLITGGAGIIKLLLGARGYKVGNGPDETAETLDRESLIAENEDLKKRLGGMEERLRVLERITTDSATRTAIEIENLRNTGPAGSPP